MSLEPHQPFDALVVISPLACGDEEKNQDRARWFASSQVATVCDGVTSSPRSAEAAELAADLSPMLFKENPRDRLHATCDLLVARRREAQCEPVVLPSGTPQTMHKMLAEVAQERMESAFQTTLVAAVFADTDKGTIVQLIRCGDSAFFAYSSAGDLLTCSPSWDQAPAAVGAEQSAVTDGIRFGPGDEVHIKVLGRASEPLFEADAGQIHPGHRSRWLVCTPLDQAGQCVSSSQHGNELPTLWLSSCDRLLIPEFLLGRVSDGPGGQYREVLYSSCIRLAADPAPPASAISFSGKGSVTRVLPDHYFTGRWIHRKEHFPSDAQFVLASDGFYGAFDDPQQLWTWLSENKATLFNEEKRQDLMQQLHECLHGRSGDDDISFVWVFPRMLACPRKVPSSKRASSKGKQQCHMKKQYPG